MAKEQKTSELSKDELKDEEKAKEKIANSIDAVLDIKEYSELSFRVNNILKLGFTKEHIVKLVEKNGLFTMGDPVSVLAIALDQISTMLIRTISEDLNGIVLNSDGTVNEAASAIQREEMESASQIKEYTPILSELKKEELVEKTAIEIEKEILGLENFKSYMDYFDKEMNKEEFESGWNNASEEDRKEIDKIVGIDRNNLEKELEEVFLSTHEEVNFIGYLSQYKRAIQSGDKESIEKAKAQILENLESIKDTKPKIYGAIKDLNEDGFQESAVKTLDDWMYKKNQEKLNRYLDNIRANYLKSGVTKSDFFDDKVENKIIFYRAMLKAFEFREGNEEIINTIEAFNEKFGLELSKEMCIEKLKEFGIDLSDPIAYNKEINSHMITLDSMDDYLVKYHRSVDNEKDKGDNLTYSQKIALEEDHNRSMTKGKVEIRKMLTDIMASRNDTNDPELEILTILDYYAAHKSTGVVATTIKEFIEENRDIFEARFKGEEVKLFSKNRINTDSVKIITERSVLKEDSKSRVQQVERFINEVHRRVNRNRRNETERKQKSQLETLIKQSVNPDVNTIKSIVDLIDNMHEDTFNQRLVVEIRNFADREDIKSIYSDKIIKALDTKIGIKQITKESVIQEKIAMENALLLEARVLLSKGDDLNYSRNRHARDEFYKNNKATLDASTDLRKGRSIFDNREAEDEDYLPPESEKKVRKFIYALTTRTIVNNIDKTDISSLSPKELESFKALLIAGLADNDVTIKLQATEKFKQIYPELEKLEGEDLRKQIFQKFYGGKGSLEVYSEKALETRSKFERFVLDSKQTKKFEEKAISDEEFDDYFNEEKLEFEIDFKKYDTQVELRSKHVSFTKEDKIIYPNLIKNMMMGSWINSKNDLIKQMLLNLEATKERFPDKTTMANASIENNILRILDENPNFDRSQVYDEYGNVKESAKAEGNNFRDKFLFAEAFPKIEKYMLDSTNYNDLNSSDKTEMLRQAIFIQTMSERYRGSSFAKTLQHLSFILFDKISETGPKLYDPEKQKIDKDAIAEEYKKMCGGKNTYEELSQKSKIQGLSVFKLRDYLYLNDDEFDDLSNLSYKERQEVIVERTENFKNKREAALKRKNKDREYVLLQKKASSLTIDEVKKLDNDIITIGYIKAMVHIGKIKSEEIEGTFQSIVNDPNKKFELVDKMVANKLENTKLQDALDNVTYMNFENQSFKNRVKSVFEIGTKNDAKISPESDGLFGDIISFNQTAIDEVNDINLSAIWYHKAIQNANRKGQIDLAENLKKDFSRNFDNQNPTEIVEKIRADISYRARNTYWNSDESKEYLKRTVLSKEAYKFVSDSKLIYKKMNRDINEFAIENLDKYFEDNPKTDKIEAISSLFNQFSKKRIEFGVAAYGTDAIENYILRNPDDFKDLIKNGKVDFKQLTKSSPDEKKYAGTFDILFARIQDKKLDEGLLIRKFNHIKDNMGERRKLIERYSYYNDLKEIISINKDEQIIPDKMLASIQQHETGNYFRAELKDRQRSSDSWTDILKGGIHVSVKAIKLLPKVALGKESKIEFLKKVFEHTLNGVERVGGKIETTFSNKNRKRINSKKSELLPSGENEFKETDTVPNLSEEKITNKAIEEVREMAENDNGRIEKTANSQQQAGETSRNNDPFYNWTEDERKKLHEPTNNSAKQIIEDGQKVNDSFDRE